MAKKKQSPLLPLSMTPKDFSCPNGWAWKNYVKGQDSRVLSNWILYAPGRGMSDLYMILMYHLRSDSEQVKKVFPQATHEIGVFGINPVIEPLIGAWPVVFSNTLYVSQWYCNSDERAQKTVETAVKDVCMGILNPVSIEKDPWVFRFGIPYTGKFRLSMIIPEEEVH